MTAIGLRILRISIDPANFIICITNIAVGDQGEVCATGLLQFGKWFGKIGRRSAVDADNGDTKRK